MGSAFAKATGDVIDFTGATIEVEVRLYPIPESQGGQEVTVNFYAYGIDTNETFYTDSNGMEMQERILNKRPTWNLTTDQTISSNYYPINSAIVINDESINMQFVVTNDRSQGGAVFDDSRVELMHNRRLFKDDARGVGEPLSENGTVVIAGEDFHKQLSASNMPLIAHDPEGIEAICKAYWDMEWA